MTDITTRVTAIVAEHVAWRMYPPEVTAETNFTAIDLDDAERGGIAVEVEREFDREFSDEAVASWTTPGCIVAALMGEVA